MPYPRWVKTAFMSGGSGKDSFGIFLVGLPTADAALPFNGSDFVSAILTQSSLRFRLLSGSLWPRNRKLGVVRCAAPVYFEMRLFLALLASAWVYCARDDHHPGARHAP